MYKKQTLPLLLLGVFLATSAGCVTRGYPTHGGGKRFYREQEIVSKAVDSAVRELSLSLIPRGQLKGNTVPVQIFSMAHSGGGVQGGSGVGIGGLLGGILGVGTAVVADNSSNPGAAYSAGTAAAVAGSAASYSSFAFESADDMRYLMGALIRDLGREELIVRTPEAGAEHGVLTILVKEMGIDQNDLNLVVYGEKRLRARVVLEAFWVSRGQGNQIHYQDIGQGQSTWSFSEDFFLGFGPLSGEQVREEPEDVAEEVQS